jgi:hypothetical protein
MRGSRRSYSLNPEQIRCQVFRFRNCLFTAYSFTTNMKSRAFQSGPYFVAVCDQNFIRRSRAGAGFFLNMLPDELIAFASGSF